MKSRAGCLISLIAAVVVVGAIAVFLFVPPSPPRPAPLAMSNDLRAMLSLVPSDAAEIAIVPASGPLLRTADRNPITAPAIDRWREDRSIPVNPLLLGRTPLVLWRSGPAHGAIARPDAFRRFLIRTILRIEGGRRLELSGPHLLIGTSGAGAAEPPWIEPAISAAGGLPGQIFLLQSGASHFGYPPIGRPAFTAVTLEKERVNLVSRAAKRADSIADAALAPSFPERALITVGAPRPPEALRAIAKSFPIDVLPLLERGAVLAVYKVDERKLIPRIHAALVIPATAEADLKRTLDAGPVPEILGGLANLGEQKRMVAGVEVIRRRGIGYTVEYAKRGDRLVVGFDKSSVDDYLTDREEPSPLGQRRAAWIVHLHPALLTPVLEKLASAEQIRMLTPDLYRTIVDLHRWTSQLRNASAITATKSTEGQWEVVRTIIEAEK